MDRKWRMLGLSLAESIESENVHAVKYGEQFKISSMVEPVYTARGMGNNLLSVRNAISETMRVLAELTSGGMERCIVGA